MGKWWKICWRDLLNLRGSGRKSAHSENWEIGWSRLTSVATARIDGHVHELHATMLRLLGIDHERLNYSYPGRRFRLTDVFGKVVEDLIAQVLIEIP